MSDSLITSKFDRALAKSPPTGLYTAMQTTVANLGILAFLTLATALGMAETEFVSEQDRPAWRAWGAPIGMSQYWRVFAPDLRRVNWYCTAVIEFADGTLKNYEFPRFDVMPLYEAFVKTRESDFFVEIMPNLHFKKSLPRIGRYLARANYDPTNQPRMVTFVIHTADLAPPNTDHWIYRDSLPPHTFSQIFFVYKVALDDLADLSARSR